MQLHLKIKSKSIIWLVMFIAVSLWQYGCMAEDSVKVNRWKLEFTGVERLAMEPPQPANLALGGPVPAGAGSSQKTADSREFSTNLLGTKFPWVEAKLHVLKPEASDNEQEAESVYRCRVRYDGDFTYMLASFLPKRPLRLELLDGAMLSGRSAFRLHTMQFDSSKTRETLASETARSFNVPTIKTQLVDIAFQVDGFLQPIGLYLDLEDIDSRLLVSLGCNPDSILLQNNGLNSLRYTGDDWSTYQPNFRSSRPLKPAEQRQVMEMLKTIDQVAPTAFVDGIAKYFDIKHLLSYLAANVVTSNTTGFSTIGSNDYLCLDPVTGKFMLLLNEMETAFGSAVLAGTPQQLADLNLLTPYASEIPLIEKLMSDEVARSLFFELIRNARGSFLSNEHFTNRINAYKKGIKPFEDKYTSQSNNMLPFQLPIGGEAGPLNAPVMDLESFINERLISIDRQIANGASGYIPKVPVFGGPTGGPSRANMSQSKAIDEQTFLESVKVQEGFVATLYAGAPKVNYPVAMAAGPKGILFVASDEQGSLGTDKGGGKILRCVDENNDGLVDQVTVFCRVDHPRGVVYRNNQLWVCHPPYLSVFCDEDGDGVSDKSEILVHGLTTELVDTRGGDHTTNGLRMGIDGWIYIGVGDYGAPNATGVDGSNVTLRGGGILRLRPNGTDLELFCSGLRNPFEIAIDSQLNLFTRDNTNDGGGWDTRVIQLFPTAEYGYPRLFANFSDEIMPVLGTYGNGGGTGAIVIEEPAWKDQFANALLTSDWGRSGVFLHSRKQAGATFKITQDEFATVPRATGMEMDVDGNLYVASWFSGEASVFVGDHVGFITRITPKNSQPVNDFDPQHMELSKLCHYLDDPSHVRRVHAQAEIIRRCSENTEMESKANEYLRKVVTDKNRSLGGRIAALFAMKQILGVRSHEFLFQVADDADLREFSIRALVDCKSELGSVPASRIVPFLDDESERVQAVAIIALGRIGDRSVIPRLLEIANRVGSANPDAAIPNPSLVVPHLAFRALVSMNPAAECIDAVSSNNWRAALRVLRYCYDDQVVGPLIERLNTETNRSKRLSILETLARLYQRESKFDGSWWGIRPDTSGPFYAPEQWEGSESIALGLRAYWERIDKLEKEDANSILKRYQLGSIVGEWKLVESSQSAKKGGDERMSTPIRIVPADPNNPKQIANMTLDGVVREVVETKGDQLRGEELFRKHGCVSCHSAKKGDNPIGPHLAEIGKRYKVAELVESLVSPSAKIAQGYETQTILLDDGSTISGFVSKESAAELTIRDSQGGVHVIDQQSIESRKTQKISTMPDGLIGNLETTDLADLIAYLQGL